MSHQTDLDKLRNSRGSSPEALDNKRSSGFQTKELIKRQ